jgi:lysine 2,3-aminomutase
MIDLPGGGGKVPLQPDYFEPSNRPKLMVRNYKGELFEYPDG